MRECCSRASLAQAHAAAAGRRFPLQFGVANRNAVLLGAGPLAGPCPLPPGAPAKPPAPRAGQPAQPRLAGDLATGAAAAASTPAAAPLAPLPLLSLRLILVLLLRCEDWAGNRARIIRDFFPAGNRGQQEDLVTPNDGCAGAAAGNLHLPFDVLGRTPFRGWTRVRTLACPDRSAPLSPIIQGSGLRVHNT